MKDNSQSRSKDVIKGNPLNKETLYYSILFGVGFIVILVLMILGCCYHNPGLAIYAGILTPIFLAVSLLSLRYTLVSMDTIYAEEGVLVVKTLLSTKKFEIAKIDKLTAATNNNDNVTTINITVGENTARYEFKNITKDEIAHLRRVTSK